MVLHLHVIQLDIIVTVIVLHIWLQERVTVTLELIVRTPPTTKPLQQDLQSTKRVNATLKPHKHSHTLQGDP